MTPDEFTLTTPPPLNSTKPRLPGVPGLRSQDPSQFPASLPPGGPRCHRRTDNTVHSRRGNPPGCLGPFVILHWWCHSTSTVVTFISAQCTVCRALFLLSFVFVLYCSYNYGRYGIEYNFSTGYPTVQCTAWLYHTVDIISLISISCRISVGVLILLES